jgi:hypothetical protein
MTISLRRYVLGALLRRRQMDRAPRRHEPGFLEPFGKRRVCGDRIGDRLDRRLSIERDHTRVDDLGRIDTHDDNSEQLVVRPTVDRLGELNVERLLRYIPRTPALCLTLTNNGRSVDW